MELGRRFDDPIAVDGRNWRPLRALANTIAALPKKEHDARSASGEQALIPVRKAAADDVRPIGVMRA